LRRENRGEEDCSGVALGGFRLVHGKSPEKLGEPSKAAELSITGTYFSRFLNSNYKIYKTGEVYFFNELILPFSQHS
jgi:hypothetical protein